ncbi:amidohydrolase [Roseovarius sp. SCSIO 43702]|uniref:amidohydrolase n=1 Tax=Roseovarius sp. SCSIO 43702 TaxID=2823043 RepID=UPI001C72E5AF|nr:amidohydrolase [Roseovarius sp. SCSIO 43702]QYX55653.1 amidohydrolase [Roseovarius sp. SCSIO 43702]
MPADLIILNGHLKTMDPAQPTAQALAIENGCIAAVGRDDEIEALAGPETRMIDAQGGTVLPGFIESHIHLFSGGVELDLLNLAGIADADSAARLIRDRADADPEARVLLAVGAEYGLLGDAPITRQGLDEIIADRPIAVMAADHHTVWANTAALELAGLLHGAEMPAGSRVEMAPDGTATGALLEFAAFQPLLAHMPTGGREYLGLTTGHDPATSPDAAAREMDKAALLRGLNHLAANGITTYHNMDGNLYQLELLQELLDEGHHVARGEVPIHVVNTDPVDRIDEAAQFRRYDTPWLWSRRLKLFADGVPESGTALMTEPYPDHEGQGQQIFSPEHMNELVARADAMGLQVSIHCCGCGAVRQALDAYEHARKVNGPRDSRHRIEHIESLHPDDLPRFAELGVVASMQPLHSPRAGFFPAPPPGQILHAHQRPRAYAWRDIRDSGAHLIFSTDWPVVPVPVMPTIQGAVAPHAIGEDWGPDQRQTLDEALASYTRDAAWVEFHEDEKGQLKPGMLGDVVILSRNLDQLAANELAQASPLVTICGGHVTYQA